MIPVDHVYVCRTGSNEELRYSLRSLERFVEHDHVWIIGGWPEWVSDEVRTVRNVPLGAGGHATTAHLQLACLLGGISDPFVLWNDDMYATEPVKIEMWHNGPLNERRDGGTWGAGQRATYKWLRDQLGSADLLSYELHVPLIVRKAEMLNALDCMREIPAIYPHKRTVYGNVGGLGGTYMGDCKVTNARARVDGPWLSSADATFRSCVLPRLTMLSEPSRFEA